MRYTDITSQVASRVRLERAATKDAEAPPVITGPDTDRPALISSGEAPG